MDLTIKIVRFIKRLYKGVVHYLIKEDPRNIKAPLCDFARLRFEVRPGDVILIEGRSHLSEVIKTVTLSRWTHAVLYIGRLADIEDDDIRNLAESYCMGCGNEHLIVEAVIGEGVLITTLEKYEAYNVRLCRPKYVSPYDVQKVIGFAVKSLGKSYHTRQILDIARLMFPYGLLPRRWRSSLFEHKAGESTHTICSTMLAEAFACVQYPILPVLQKTADGKIRWYRRNAKLFVPADFDHSPYFDVIKYPFLGDDVAIYRKLPWDRSGVLYSDDMDEFHPEELEGITVLTREDPDQGDEEGAAGEKPGASENSGNRRDDDEEDEHSEKKIN